MLQLTDDSPQLSSMLLHSVPTKGLEGRSLLDFFTEPDRARISQQFQSSIASETTSVMALNADMLDSDQNRVNVELFHAQFRNLANHRCFLVGVREVQDRDAMGAPASSVAAGAMESNRELSALFDVPSFDILALSTDLEQLCQSHLGQAPKNLLDMSCPSRRSVFCDTLQVLTNKTLQGHPDEQGKEATFQFNLLGAGDVTAAFSAERDELLDTAVGQIRVLTSLTDEVGAPSPSLQVHETVGSSQASVDFF